MIEDLTFDAPKTSQAAETLEGLEPDRQGPAGRCRSRRTSGSTEKSFRNLHGVRIAYAKSLGVYEVIASDKLVLTSSALDALAGALDGAASDRRRNEPQPSTDDTADEEQAEPSSATAKGEDA